MKMTNQIAVFAALLSVTGCNPAGSSDGGKQPESPGKTGAVMELPKSSPIELAGQVTTPVPLPTVTESKPPAADNKDTIIASIQEKLRDFDAKIDELARKSEGYKDDARAQADQALAALREQRTRLNAQLDSLKQASAEAWAELKAGFDAACTDLQKALENARSKFS